MLSQGIHTRPRVLASALFAVLVAAAVALGAASPAAAHDELVSSDPAADAELTELPAELTLTFSNTISTEDGATEIEVTDAAGTSLADGSPTVAETVVTQPLTGSATGAITVLWKVVSSDGHPISGELSFTVSEPAPTPTPTPTASASPTSSPEPTESASPSPTATPEPTAATGAGPWGWIIAGVLALGLITAVTYLLVTRAQQRKALDDARGGGAAGGPNGASEGSAGR